MAKTVVRSRDKAERLLEACRYPEALAAFRAALIVDPADPVAHVGIAECTIALGQYELAIDRLVHGAHRLAAAGNRHAHTLVKRAMVLSPNRLELHVDAAEIELALGEAEVARERLWRLAAAYRGEGRRDDAIAIEELVAAWQDDEPEDEVAAPRGWEPGSVEPAQTGHTLPLQLDAGVPSHVPPSVTEAVSEVVLLFPDGTPMPIPRRRAGVRQTVEGELDAALAPPAIEARKAWGKAPRRRPPAGSVRFRVQPPPKLRRPAPR